MNRTPDWKCAGVILYARSETRGCSLDCIADVFREQYLEVVTHFLPYFADLNET